MIAAASPTMLNARNACMMCFRRSLSASSSVVSSYSSTRHVNEVFFQLKRKRKTTTTCVSYGGLQAAYIKNCGLVVQSYQMVDTDSISSFFPWDDLLREYVKKNRLVEARRIFDIMPERSTVSWHVIILGYIKIGHMREARTLFESSPKIGMVWESMICGYATHGMSKLALKIFKRRPGKNMLTGQMLVAGHFIGNMQSEATKMARDKNPATWNLLIEGNLYLGLKDGARPIFDEMDKSNVDRNAMSWNLMIAAHSRVPLFCRPLPKMPTLLRNSHSWNLMITARRPRYEVFEGENDKLFEEALTIFHLHMPEKQQNAASWNALIYLYLKREKLDEARFYFDNMPQRNPHSWGLMLAAYLQNGMLDEAKKIFFDRDCDDLHSWVLILGWFVKKKKTVDEAMRFLVDNVPKRPLSFYSIACACIKHGLREEAKLVLESMQATMHTNLNIHQTITFVEEKLKEKRGPLTNEHFWMRYMVEKIEFLETVGNFSHPDYENFVSEVKDQGGPMFEFEPHSHSGDFMQILDSEIDAHGDFSQIFLKGSCDCCGLLQV